MCPRVEKALHLRHGTNPAGDDHWHIDVSNDAIDQFTIPIVPIGGSVQVHDEQTANSFVDPALGASDRVGFERDGSGDVAPWETDRPAIEDVDTCEELHERSLSDVRDPIVRRDRGESLGHQRVGTVIVIVPQAIAVTRGTEVDRPDSHHGQLRAPAFLDDRQRNRLEVRAPAPVAAMAETPLPREPAAAACHGDDICTWHICTLPICTWHIRTWTSGQIV